MTIQIARGKQVFHKKESQEMFASELYIEICEGFYVAAKLDTAHMGKNLGNTYGSLLLTEAELSEILRSGYLAHPRGGYIYREEELSSTTNVRSVVVRWDTESRRIC